MRQFDSPLIRQFKNAFLAAYRRSSALSLCCVATVCSTDSTVRMPGKALATKASTKKRSYTQQPDRPFRLHCRFGPVRLRISAFPLCTPYFD